MDGRSNDACHVCGEPCVANSDALRCANAQLTLANGRPACTKVVCRQCFATYGWDFAAAWADDRWTCTHCRQVCPQCFIVPIAGQRGSLGAQLAHAENTARYVACLKTISDNAAQQPQAAESESFVDRLATMLTTGEGGAAVQLAGATLPLDLPPRCGAAESRYDTPGLFDPQQAMAAAGAVDLSGAPCDPHPLAGGGSSSSSSHPLGSGLSAEERLVCWGSPAVSGDAWGHESGAGAAMALRIGTGGSTRAHPLLVLIGGRTTASMAADPNGTLVQAFDPNQRRWLRVQQSGVPPTRLRAHALCAFGTRILLAGGGDGKRLSSELFALDVRASGASADAEPGGLVAAVAELAGAAMDAVGGGLGNSISCEWSHPQVRGAAPPARVGHCAARMGRASMLIFGGFASDGSADASKSGGGSSSRSSKHREGGKKESKHSKGGKSGSYSNAIYAFDAERATWAMPTVHIEGGCAPPLARIGASATAVHEHEILLYGGSHHGQPTAALDVLTASADISNADAVLKVGQPLTTGTPPPPRFSHCAVLLGHSELAIFGGGGGPDGRMVLGDVALLDVIGMRWTVLEFRGVPPAPRVGAIGAAVGAERRLWLFGGCTSVESLPLNDVHSLDVSRRSEEETRAAAAEVKGASAAACSAGGGVACAGPTKADTFPSMTTTLAPRLRPPPRARLAPAHSQLKPVLKAAPIKQLVIPAPPPPPPPPPPPVPTGANSPLRSHALQARGAMQLTAQNVTVSLRNTSSAASTSNAPAPAGIVGPVPDASFEIGPRGECTTTLIRRDGVYVLKTVKDEFCTGCEICKRGAFAEIGGRIEPLVSAAPPPATPRP